MVHSVKTHPFHLKIDFTRLMTIATLNILVLPPRFIMEPAKYRPFVNKRRFITVTSIPALTDVTETGFAVLGVLGVDYANVLIGKAFRTIAMGMSVDNTLKRGYEAVWSAVKIYAHHWRKKKDVKVELRQPLLSEKTPRKPVERTRIIKTKISRVNMDALLPIETQDSRGVVETQPNQRSDDVRDSSTPEEKESQDETVRSPLQESAPEDVSSTPQNRPYHPQYMRGSRNVSPMYDNASGSRILDLHTLSPVSMLDLSSSPPWLTPRYLRPFPNTAGSQLSRPRPLVSPTIHLASLQRTIFGESSSRIPRPNFNKGSGSLSLETSDILALKMGRLVKRSADEEPFQMSKRRKLNVGPTTNSASAGMKSYIPTISSRSASHPKLPIRIGPERRHYIRNRLTSSTKQSRIPRLQKQSVSVKTRLLESSRIESVISGNSPSPLVSLEHGIVLTTSSLPETFALTRIYDGWDHPENVGARLSLDDEHDPSISAHPPLSNIDSEIQASTSSLSIIATAEPPGFSPSIFTNYASSDSGESTFRSPSIPSSPSITTIPLPQSLQVSPEFHELLRLSIYPILHLATSVLPLEQLTLRDWVAICLLAKQRGAIRAFKKLWGKYPVKPPIDWEVNDEDPCECIPTPTEIDSQHPEMPTLSFQSPVRDLSPPPPFRRGRIRGKNQGAAVIGPKYRYYRATFIERDLPVMLVGHCCPVTKNLMCCYGGKRNGERVYFSSWRCVSHLNLYLT
jgi:hypothetical protein